MFIISSRLLVMVCLASMLSACKDTGNRVVGWMNDSFGRSTLSVPSLTLSVVEGSSHSVLIALDRPISRAADLSWSLNAPSGRVQASSGVIHLVQGSQAGVFQVDTIDDGFYAGDQTYELALSGDLTVFANTLTINLIIKDDEEAGLTKIWDLTDASVLPSLFDFDPDVIEFAAGNTARLKTVDTQFTTEDDFGRGTHAGTYWDSVSNALKIVGKTHSSLSVNEILPSRSTNLLGYWRMDGDLSDSSGSGKNAVVNGSISYSPVSKVGSGALDSTVSATDFVSVGGFDVGTAGFSASAWLYLESFNDFRRVLSETNVYPTRDWMLLEHSTDGAFYVEVRLTSGFCSTNGGLPGGKFVYVDLNVWTHLVVVYNGSSLSIYKNGVLAAGPLSCSNPMANTASNLGIGSDSNGASAMDGKIDEVAIWNTPLSGPEVANLYNAQAQFMTELSSSWTPQWSNLAGYWKMDGDWLDSSGNGNHGVPSDAPSFESSRKKVGLMSGNFEVSSNSTHSESVELGSVGTSLDDSRDFSILFWMLDSGSDTLFHPLSFGDGKFSFQKVTGGRLSLHQPFGSTSFDLGPYNQNQWYHVAVVSTDGQWTALLNGEVVASGTTATGINGSDDLIVGARYTGSADHWRGNIDDVAVFTAGLAISEVYLIYNRQKQKYAGSYDSPVIDLGAPSATWESMTLTSRFPYLKELSGAGDSSADYSDMISGLGLGLKGLWHLNASSYTGAANEVEDTSGNLAHGSANLLVEGQEGVLGRAPMLSGTNNITIPHSKISSITDSLTTCSWLKSDDPAGIYGWDLVLSKADGSFGWYMQRRSTGAKLHIRADTSAGYNQQWESNGNAFDGDWHHVCLSFEGGQMQLWIDGRLDRSETYQVGTGFDDAAPLRIGVDYGGTSNYRGQVDEVALWNRSLSNPEVLHLYRRGANRIKYQVRSCDDTSCSGEGWIGPDGTALTYFSELHNNTAIDSSGNPTGLVNTGGLSLEFANFPALASASPVKPQNNRYFQYRVYMESDDKNDLCSGAPCMPELTSVEVGPTGRYYGGGPTLVNKTAFTAGELVQLTAVDTSGCTKYQLSVDGGTSWKWYNTGTSVWETATGGVTETNAIGDYTADRLGLLGPVSFKFKAYLTTNAAQDLACSLSSVSLTYR